GGPLAELALVQDVIGREQRPPKGTVDRVRLRAGPARVGDAALVDDHRNPAPPREAEERRGVARQPRRSEIEEREVGRMVGETRRKALELRRTARNGLPLLGAAVV